MGFMGDLLIRIGGDASGARTAIRGVRTQTGLLGSSLKAVFRTAVVAGFFMAIRSVVMVFQQLKTFVSSTLSEMVKLNTAGIRTAVILTKGGSETASTFKAVAEQARALSTQVSNTAIEIQEGLFTAAIAGYNLSDSFKVATSSMKMAQIAGFDFKSTIDGLIGVVNAFHFSMSDIPKIADTITAAFSHSKMTLQGFFTAIKYVASAAAVTFGSSAETFRDVAAALMTMNQAGLTSSKSGVYLRSAMLKLNSATSKITGVMAKYNVNMYDAKGETQKWIPTIYKAQKGVSELTEELNVLKLEQLGVANSSGTTSKAFEEVSERVSDVTGRMEKLKSGLGDVFSEFTMAGGKLKPLNQLLIDIEANVPKEVVMRAFGIRSGQGIALLLDQISEYKKNIATLDKFEAASLQGDSIVESMFGQMIGAVGIQWQKMVNSMTGSFSVVAESLFSAFAPLMDNLVWSFQEGYKLIESWAPLFDRIFMGVAVSFIEPMLAFLRDFGTALKKFDDIALSGMGTGDVSLPMYSYSKDKGVTSVAKVFEAGTPMTELMKGLADSLFSAINAHIAPLLEQLKGVFGVVAGFLVQTIIAKLKFYMPFFKQLGVAIGEGVREGLLGWFSSDEAVDLSKKYMSMSPLGKITEPITSIANPIQQIGITSSLLGAFHEGGITGLAENITEKLQGFITSIKESFNLKGVEKSMEDLEPPKDVLAGITNTLGSWKNVYASFKSDLRKIEGEVAAIERAIS